LKNPDTDKREVTDFTVMTLLIFFSFLPLLLHMNYNYLPRLWLQEDGIYESIAALACIGAGLAVVWITGRSTFTGNWVLFWSCALALSLLILGGEELSWGQRIFDFQTPEFIADSNYQREFNLHNSTLIQSQNNALSVYLAKLLVIYLVIFPLFVKAFPSAHRMAENLSVPVPGLAVSLTALIALLVNAQTFRIIYGSVETTDDLSLGEAFESILELCLCWASLHYVCSMKRRGKTKGDFRPLDSWIHGKGNLKENRREPTRCSSAEETHTANCKVCIC